MPLKNSAVRLFRDDAGVLSSIDYILFVTILTIGSVVGLATVRDGVMQEFGDIGVAIETLEQSYTVDITFRNGSTQRFGWDQTGRALRVVCGRWVNLRSLVSWV
ncbi:MAG: hypothetical protein O3C17_01755, partial [Planctomycetota bacterium]|nr:hypothetical protein [Planctomycetota bacterium]